MIFIFALAMNPSIYAGDRNPSSQQDNHTSLNQIMTGGTISLSLRYRYESYAQQSSPSVPITANAQATTLRLALGYKTKATAGFSGFAEYEGVHPLGYNLYRITTVPSKNIPTLPIISDPVSSELNQYFLKYSNPFWKTLFKAGRQEIVLGNGRFVDYCSWRQNHQSLDAYSLQSAPLKNLSAYYAYATKVYRVVGPDATDGRLSMATHMANLTYQSPRRFSASIYSLLLNEYDAPANSTKNFGLRLEGPYKLSDTFGILFAAEFANQTNYAGNPYHVDENYCLGELGAAYRDIALKVQYNVRQAKSLTDKFNTPLSRPWDGWVEKFLSTPSLGTTDHGLKVLSISLGGPVPRAKGLTAVVAGYDYHAYTGCAHYGRELDAGLEYRLIPVDKNMVVGWRFGQYFADHLYTDSLRTSGYAAYEF
ncbi:MAG: hypothetical protein LHV69_06185 [Elusimicrobia bacterium]|nr:hypothetical protein [Candidatus Obscuribacterium magneticum]